MAEMSSAQQTSTIVNKVDAAVSVGELSCDAAGNLKRWLTRPEYGRYQSQLQQMIEAGDFETLTTLFFESIPFGTGGRRGLMSEMGSATINARTIAESAQGLATYLQDHKQTSGGRAVIACDTRNRSDEFARLVATTLAANGLHVFFFDTYRSTPQLSFAVRHLQCDVGVMITASHNPPSDNGFKAYWSNGGQVLSPHDKGIIDRVAAAEEIPTLDFDQAVSDGKIELLGADLDTAYIDTVCGLSLSTARSLPGVFTPLHGVGETSAYRALQQAGFSGIEIFEPQRDPDGNFTNVPDHLPNPERFEVFQPAIERARETGGELVLASDPDADRLGACVRNGDGEFIHLTGNRIGALLADYILRKRAAANSLTSDHFVVETLVTTPLIGAIAQSHGVRVIDDLLVGFKYIGETMDREGADRFVFGVEESLGYLAGDHARDKDASVAALYLAELAAELREEGKSLLDRLDELYVELGYFTEGQQSVVRGGEKGQQQIRQLIDQFRNEPPTELAGISLGRVRDYGQHEIRSLPSNEVAEPLPEPRDNLLFFETENTEPRIALAVRPSGTEPKIKFYTFAQAACEQADGLAELKQETDEQLALFQQELSVWVGEVLKRLDNDTSPETGS
ncbi:MAG: phospho-sugar mutase [Planctomycetaceae bacterium]|jgi:phosphoglucomutase|nr:phospho-sugar mutase [Planctomycetaceae bacterium]MBT6485470.1 phospho-sugar mutase [Planctomycetaceae bacterium]MBT6497266.1 phospho-sugar mutase [Planctomycetaceae bacterium]